MYPNKRHYRRALTVLVFTIISLCAISFVFAQEPVTPADFKAILNEAAQTSKELKKVNENEESLKAQVGDWKQRLDEHNANRCEFPPENPGVCAQYEREKQDLDAERDRLKTAVDKNDSYRRMLKSRLGMLKARLRLATMSASCGCDGLAPEEASACWSRCFDGADRRLTSCLDIDDLDVFASCLNRR